MYHSKAWLYGTNTTKEFTRFQKPGREDAHVIEILTESTSHAYRTYLRDKGISYILAVKIL